MRYEDYQKAKVAGKRLFSHFKKKIQVANQPVFIRNIFVYGTQTKGEFLKSNASSNTTKAPTIKRLGDHIDLIAGLANEYHQQYYCTQKTDGTYEIKEDCLNKITRILLPEFFLYTETPLTIDDLGLLIDRIYEIAKNQQSNVHLLLSTLALAISLPPSSEKKILNVCLYIQCGKTPKIEVFCKANGLSSDPSYSYGNNFVQKPGFSIKNLFSPIEIVPYIGSIKDSTLKKSVIIWSDSVSIITTEGGAQFFKSVDICYDHGLLNSKQLLNHLGLPSIPNFTETVKINSHSHSSLAKDENSIMGNAQTRVVPKDGRTMPDQADQILTSDSMNVEESAKISTSIIQIDTIENRAKHISNDLFIESLLKKKQSQQSQMTKPKSETSSETSPALSIQISKNGFLVKNPPFGPEFEVVAAEEKPVGNFTKDLKAVIEKRNNYAMRGNIASQLEQLPHGKEYNLLMSNLDNLLISLESFKNYLNERYKEGSFEKYFSFFSQSSLMLKGEIYSKIIHFSNLLKSINQIRDEDETDYNDILDKCSGLLQELKIALEHIRLKQPGRELKKSLEEDEKHATSLIEKINLMEKVIKTNNNHENLVSTTNEIDGNQDIHSETQNAQIMGID